MGINTNECGLNLNSLLKAVNFGLGNLRRRSFVRNWKTEERMEMRCTNCPFISARVTSVKVEVNDAPSILVENLKGKFETIH